MLKARNSGTQLCYQLLQKEETTEETRTEYQEVKQDTANINFNSKEDFI